MNNFSKMSILIATSASMLFACADEDFAEHPYLIYSQHLSDQKWEPFLPDLPRYSPYNYSENKPELPSLNTAIIKEWHTYKPSVSESQWESFLFDSGSAPELTENEQQYFAFIKRVEPFVQNEFNWDYEGFSSEQIESMKQLSSEAIALALRESSNPFLQQRYIFQALRLSHFSGDYSSVLAITEQTKWEKSARTTTYWRMVALKAGSLRYLKQPGEAMVQFVNVAINSPELLYLGYRNCMYIADWKAGLAAAKQPETKAMMLFLQTVYENNLNPQILRQLAEIEPSSSRMEVCMLKQVSHAPWSSSKSSKNRTGWKDSSYLDESAWSSILTADSHVSSAPKKSWWTRFTESIAAFFRKLFHLKPKVSSTTDLPSAISILHVENPVYTSDSEASVAKATKELLEIAVAMTTKKEVPNKSLYYLCASYLSFKLDNMDETKKFAEKATTASGTKEATLVSAKLFIALAELSQNGVSSDKFTTSAEQFLKTEPDSLSQSTLYEYAGNAYLLDHQYGNAAATFMANDDNFGKTILDCIINIPELDSLQNMKKSPASELLKLVYTSLPHDSGFAELAGNKFMRCGEFAQAVDRFSRCGDSYWEERNSHTITEEWDDVSSYYRRLLVTQYSLPFADIAGQVSLTRFAFAQKAVELSSKKNYDQLMALGNLFFWDWGWHYSDILWRGYGLLDQVRNFDYHSGSVQIDQDLANRMNMFMANYAAQQMAARFYAQAIDLAKSDEEKAIAMLAFTTAKSTNWTSASESTVSALNKTTLFKKLSDQYGKTKAVESFKQRCSELRDFIATQK